MIVFNENQRSSDYSEIASYYRPGHADYTYDMKYGFRDYRGGGRSSGRETISRVAAGAIAVSILKELGIQVYAYTKSIGPVTIDYHNCRREYSSMIRYACPILRLPGKPNSISWKSMRNRIPSAESSNAS